MVAALRRAIQRRRLSWLTKRIKILPVESAKRGFDRGAEAGYAVADRAAEKRDPNPGVCENFRATDRRRAAGMELVV